MTTMTVYYTKVVNIDDLPKKMMKYSQLGYTIKGYRPLASDTNKIALSIFKTEAYDNRFNIRRSP